LSISDRVASGLDQFSVRLGEKRARGTAPVTLDPDGRRLDAMTPIIVAPSCFSDGAWIMIVLLRFVPYDRDGLQVKTTPESGQLSYGVERPLAARV
jgi:hypothetical protein